MGKRRKREKRHQKTNKNNKNNTKKEWDLMNIKPGSYSSPYLSFLQLLFPPWPYFLFYPHSCLVYRFLTTNNTSRDKQKTKDKKQRMKEKKNDKKN